MKKHSLPIAILLVLTASTTFAQSRGYVSIPASAFSGQDSHKPFDYSGNQTGTARSFNVMMLAPANLPHGATVTSLQCGGRASFNHSVVFTLRRNEPQQANVDLTTVKTSLAGTGFEFVRTNRITAGKVNNAKFNYYIVAEIEEPDISPPTRAFCPKCLVGFCRIGYTEP